MLWCCLFTTILVAFSLPFALVATEVCDISNQTPEVLSNGLHNINVQLLHKTCYAEFTIPRLTWTIEPAPDGINRTSVYTYPPNIGKVKTADPDKEYFEGIIIDMDAIYNSTQEIAILIQTPNDVLEYVSVNSGMPFYVNIIDGFTALSFISVWGSSACDYYDGCPQCNTLFTSNDIKDIGPKVVADLSSVDLKKELDVENETVSFIQPLNIQSWGDVYDLTIVLPLKEEGVGVKMDLKSADANVYIKGNIKCDDDENVVPSLFEYTNENYCKMAGTDTSGCTDCSNSLTIDGSIFGYFNVSGTMSADNEYKLEVDISQDDGCDNVIWGENQYESMPAPSTSMVCTDGAEANVVFDTSLPCIGDTGTLDCGYSAFGYDGCFCKVPFKGSDNYCPAIVSGATAISLLMFWASTFSGLLAAFYL